MDSIRRFFTWCLTDVHLWTPLSEFSTESPTYTMGDSLCQFYLKFQYDGKAKTMSIFACRGHDDGPAQVDMRFVISLQTASRRSMYTSKGFRPSLRKGGSDGVTVTSMGRDSLLQYLENEQLRDTIVITCDSTLLEPSMTYVSEDVRSLYDDLGKLRDAPCFRNACLITGGERIPVCKEILCSRSSFWRILFQHGLDSVEQGFPAAVVKAVIDYVYSGRISLRGVDDFCFGQLPACANHYEIYDLEKLLTPKTTNVSSFLHTFTETRTLYFTTFTNLCRTSNSVEHHRIRMNFNEAIEMSVRIIFGPDNRRGSIAVETSLWNLVGVKSVFVRLFILDDSNTPRTVDEIPLVVRHERQVMFRLEYNSETLFSTRREILSRDVLPLRFELKFYYPQTFPISDPGAWDGDDPFVKHDPSYCLVKSMESLLESKIYSDAFLLLSPSETQGTSVIRVHKSVLSLRSPVFEDKFRTDEQIRIDEIGVNENVLKVLLHYVYTGILLTAHVGTLDVLHRVAAKYRIDTLKRACEEAVRKCTMYHSNVLNFYSIAVRSEQHELQMSCLNFIMQNRDLIIGNSELEKLRENDKHAWDRIMMRISSLCRGKIS